MAQKPDDQTPCEFGGGYARGRRPAYRHAPFLRSGEVDRPISHTARHQQLQVGQTLDERAHERRPLAHDANDLEILQSLSDGSLVIDVVLKDLYLYIAAEPAPVGQARCHFLIVVKNRYAHFLHIYFLL